MKSYLIAGKAEIMDLYLDQAEKTVKPRTMTRQRISDERVIFPTWEWVRDAGEWQG